jgi:hypothetical protein
MAFKKTTKTDEIKYEVKEELGTVCEKGGWELKIRLISWNGGAEKYDIRKWKTDKDGSEKCGKGIGLTGEEMEALTVALVKIMED